MKKVPRKVPKKQPKIPRVEQEPSITLSLTLSPRRLKNFLDSEESTPALVSFLGVLETELARRGIKTWRREDFKHVGRKTPGKKGRKTARSAR